MTNTRVMIVDDSAVIRKLLNDVLASEQGIQVVCAASDGNDCLRQVAEAAPDVIVLDVEMPNLDGLGTLRELRSRRLTVPVIMFSTLTERGSKATIEALTLGASDYVAKPSNTGDFMSSIKRVREDLVPKIRALHRDRAKSPVAANAATATPSRPQPRPTTASFALPGRGAAVDAVVIGVSTGGPNALAEFIPQLPAELPVPVFIVQHMPATFTPLLAERLDQRARLKVIEATDGMLVEAGKVYIAPGDFHMTVVRELTKRVIRLNQEKPENSCRPAADVLFRSAAEAYDRRLLGVVMTGMGHDGTVGARAIKSKGGQVIVQDEASSVVWSMAGSVFRAGLADGQFALQDLARATVQHVGQAAQPRV